LKREKHGVGFKVRVALEAVKGAHTVSGLTVVELAFCQPAVPILGKQVFLCPRLKFANFFCAIQEPAPNKIGMK
jgi:hypothetical protein